MKTVLLFLWYTPYKNSHVNVSGIFHEISTKPNLILQPNKKRSQNNHQLHHHGHGWHQPTGKKLPVPTHQRLYRKGEKLVTTEMQKSWFNI